MLIGAGYGDAEVADAQAVFHEYAEEASMFNGTAVVVRQSGVNRDGVAMWVIGGLEAHFKGRRAFFDRVLAM